MGSIPKSKKAQSAIAFDNNYFKVYNDCLMICTNNFGFNKEKYCERKAPKKAEKESDESYSLRLKKFEERFSTLEIFLDVKKRECARLSEEILYHIKQANSVYPNNLAECDARRVEQDKAIGCCFALLTQYQIVLKEFCVPADRYVEVVENLEKEINSLKKWRQSDNRFRDNILTATN